MVASNDTLSVASVNLILVAARHFGADSDALIQAVGIRPEQLPDPDGRVPIRQVQALWREIVTVTGKPDIALQLGELINPVAFGVLAYVMMHSPTLGKAFEKLCRYQDIACEGLRTELRRAGDQCVMALHLTSSDIIYPEYVLNSELSVYMSAIRMMTNQSISPTEIRFAYPRPADIRTHERMFAPARLTFDADVTELVMPADVLDIPILNASPALSVLFDQHADELLRKLRQPSLSARVQTEIVTLMKGEEPLLSTVADRLAMGVRTLQLHLKDEGTTYQQLLNDTRRTLALQHLREPALSTTDVAYLLGFTEPSAFFRSFRKWTGQTPGAYRLAYQPAGY